MEIPVKPCSSALAIRRSNARAAVYNAISYEQTYRKLQRIGAMHNVTEHYQKLSILAWDEVEETYSELARYKDRMNGVVEHWDELENRIYDV